MENQLIRIGLSRTQAKVYVHLLSIGQITPPKLADDLHLTRSNAYKMLEKLESLGLAQKTESNKKLVYQAADPTALASIAAEKRNQAIAAEHAANKVMQELSTLRRENPAGAIATGDGRRAIVNAYQHQAAIKQPVYFLRPTSDIPFMGFETMHRIRMATVPHRTQRYGITPDTPDAPIRPEIDKRSFLERTPIPANIYTAPVEWTVCDDELLIVAFHGSGQYIRIRNRLVAEAFRQIWGVLNIATQTSPELMIKRSKAKRSL